MSEQHSCPSCEQYADKTSWGPGPWQDEGPDRQQFEHAGFPCIIHRGGGGSWCGYVGIPPEHPLHGKGYSEPETEHLEAHGGITYAHQCAGCVCHVPNPGEPDDVWWFGFDCAHCDDMSPSYSLRLGGLFGRQQYYWTAEEVKEETRRLAEQLVAGEKSMRVVT